MTSEEFMTYDDYQRELENDRYPDDGYSDIDFRDPDGYCEHGNYVGGCGADLMCGDCEMGISAAERREINAAQHLRKVREQADTAQSILRKLLVIPECGGTLAAHMAEFSCNVNNPASRYGRTGWR